MTPSCWALLTHMVQATNDEMKVGDKVYSVSCAYQFNFKFTERADQMRLKKLVKGGWLKERAREGTTIRFRPTPRALGVIDRQLFIQQRMDNVQADT